MVGIGQLTAEALRHKKARGERVGSVPFGCQLGADGAHLEPNQREQDALRLMRDLRSQGKTLRETSAQLAAAGYMNRKGKPFDLSALHRLTQPQ
jgi:hypothetical protein